MGVLKMKSFKQYINEKIVFPRGDDYWIKAAEFFLEKYRVDPKSVDIAIQFKKGFKEKDGLTVQSQQFNNRFMVYIGENHPPADMLRVISHEMVHVAQVIQGDLKLDHFNNRVYWKGEEVDLEKVSYNRRPWEIEAYKLEKKYLFDFPWSSVIRDFL